MGALLYSGSQVDTVAGRMGRILKEEQAGNIAVAVEVAGSHWHSHFVTTAGPTSAIEVLRAENCASRERTSLATVGPIPLPYLDEAGHSIGLASADYSSEDFVVDILE